MLVPRPTPSGVRGCSGRPARRTPSAAALFACSALLLAGCEGKSGTSITVPPPIEPITITVQPLSQVAPPGSPATFTAAATSSAPLTYQWMEDGNDIPGATDASYTTPPISPGAIVPSLIGTYQVLVGNSAKSLLSADATLTAGPRSPKAGDLRYLLFQQVGAGWEGAGGFATVGDNVEYSFSNALGSPLSMGYCSLSDGCGWAIYEFPLPESVTGLTMNYNLGADSLGSSYSSIESALQSMAAPNVVIDSLDIETTMGTYAVSSVETAQDGGFDYKLETVPMGPNLQAQIQARAAADGVASRVITAVSFDDSSQLVYLVSYGWTGDTTTIYEDQTVVAQLAGAVPDAITLASDGYIISAFGGNDTDGYVLIGMREKGDTLPRPLAACYDPHEEPQSANPANFTNVLDLFTTACAEQ